MSKTASRLRREHANVYRVGVDVGGTFTDVVAVDGAGVVTIAKAASTPADPSVGVIDGLGLLAASLDLDLAAFLRATDWIVHGTTVATNALLERKGAKVALLTTEGHRDVLEMREGLKDDRYNLRMAAPEPLVPRARRIGIRERTRADGRIAVPLENASLHRALDGLRRDGVESVAVCYLHSYRNPRHERLTRTAVERALPGVYVSLSSEVLPQIKEYERVSTTVVNASVGPVLGRYLDRLGDRLAQAGFRGAVLIMQSHGGIVRIDQAIRLAAGAVLSGPAGGVSAARHCGRLSRLPNLIAFDMGGTSTDISLITGGEPQYARERGVGGHRVSLPSLDIASIGAGGGSIAHVDGGGILRVGPASAGADPGPACYGRGGVHATVTDANLALGYLDGARFLGGRTPLSLAAAHRAVDAIAQQLGCGSLHAAAGIQQVVNTQMAEGIRLVSVRRGVDPRRFSLLAFGGAAGIHITDVARRLEMRRVLVPRLASVLSAWGMLTTDLRYEVVQTHVTDATSGKKASAAVLRRLLARMEREGRKQLSKAFRGSIGVHRALDMRYGEQIFEITVSLDGLDLAAADLMDRVVDRFHRRHEELYTYSVPGQEVVLVNARVAVVGELPKLPGESRTIRDSGPQRPRPIGKRRIYVDRWLQAPVFDIDSLGPGQTVAGPAIVESATTTVLLRPGDSATVNEFGWLDIGVGLR
ncbi:MAG: hydantoinase/oxoprolinase family protein [Acidobacteria bacterium]|nr:hydantoinase/oxoprolinase family protein [Acidobacteriota bacterium]